jgi:signal peptidase I
LSLAFFIGIILATFVESLFLGTILLYLCARCFRAPEVTLMRAAVLCVTLSVIPAGPLLLALAIERATASTGFAVLALVILFAGCVCLPWYIAKRVLRTGWWRGLAVWVSAWVPLTLVNMALPALTTWLFAESFIVPTGAMAPTVIGAHADRVCPNCGCRFAVSLSEWVRRDDFGEPDRSSIETYCPNCRQPHVVDAQATLLRGDRLLADKTIRPDRWSVAVFRNPRNRKESYVKRTVGLPGETIELAVGDVFINGKRVRKDPHVATDLWIAIHDTALVPKETDTSTPLWRPRGKPSRWRQRGGQWSAKGETAGHDLLEFTGNVTDFLAYNDYSFRDTEREHPVDDVLVTCEIGEFHGPGGLGFDWGFGESSVHVEAKSDGKIVVEATSALPSGEIHRASANGQCKAAIASGDSLSFAVRDGQAYVMHNRDVISLAIFGPDDVESVRDIPVPAAGCRLAISAEDCSVALNRITIHRDVYFIGSELDSNPLQAGTGTPLQLADNEYFMLGDNSARSLDSRFFGGVPGTDIIGVVRWTYWPKSRWHELK